MGRGEKREAGQTVSVRDPRRGEKKRTVPTTVAGRKEPPMRDQNVQGGNKGGAEKDSRDKQGPERRQDKKGSRDGSKRESKRTKKAKNSTATRKGKKRGTGAVRRAAKTAAHAHRHIYFFLSSSLENGRSLRSGLYNLYSRNMCSRRVPPVNLSFSKLKSKMREHFASDLGLWRDLR